MEEKPDFLATEVELAEVEGFHQPLQSNRRGELLAWLSTLGAAIGSGVILWRSGQAPGLGVTAFILFGLIAILISFGNWVERNTELQVTKEGVSYHSPLRRRSFSWQEVEQVRIMDSRHGWRVQVIADHGSFHYQSQGWLEFGGVDSMELGFPAGLAIAAFIQQRCHLDEQHRDGSEWVYRRPAS